MIICNIDKKSANFNALMINVNKPQKILPHAINNITCRSKMIEISDNLWSKYLCYADCGKAGVPSIYEYTICKVTTCKVKKNMIREINNV